MFDIYQPEMINLRSSTVHEVVVDSRDELSWNIPLSVIASRHLSTMSDQELDEDWKLNDLFGTIMVINLPRSKERRVKVIQELDQIGTQAYEIFPAIDGRTDIPSWIWQKFQGNREHYNIKTAKGKEQLNKLHQGEAGCYMSHYTIIKNIKEAFDEALADFNTAVKEQNEQAIEEAEKRLRKYSRVLILEDDVGFGIITEKRDVSKYGTGRVLREALSVLPDSWDILYFFCLLREPAKQISPYLCKIGNSWCLTAYAINHSMYGPLVDALKKIEDPSVTFVEAVDEEISVIQHKYETYLINPSIAFVQSEVSEISGREKHPLWQPQPFFYSLDRLKIGLEKNNQIILSRNSSLKEKKTSE